jgi:nucleotide-binding universal stress UspA family protein
VKREETGFAQQASRWARVGVLTLTTLGPAFSTLLAWLRQRSQSVSERSDELEDAAHDARAAASQQLDEFTYASRQKVVEQAEYLQKQARQLNAQAKQLRTTLRREQRQRRKLNKTLKQLRQAGIDWSQELLKRGENLRGDLVVQGGKISSDLLERSGEVSRDWAERGSKISHDLAERGSKLTQDLSERGSQLTQGLVKRGTEVSQDLAGRSKQQVQPKPKRNSPFWAIFGFTAGLVAAAVVTYLFIRRRMLQREIDQSQQIELPQDQLFDGMVSPRPTGTILHIDSNGSSVATVQAVNLEQNVAAPADAAFVGVVSTKQYYPISVPVEAKDVVYFISEEEATSEGFSAAE